jgi:UDP-galactopyranose mutase
MRDRHRSTHCFPSSIDAAHFARARARLGDPADQARIGRPRIGYAGVIDERIDLDLIDAVAAARPDLEIVLVGPTAKIDPADVPAHRNVHRLGLKPYADLPAYLGGWDIGWMPFARNEATRFISPTKTPEYLAAGLPVISTSIHDVVEPYGTNGLVAIADLPADTLRTIDRTLADGGPDRDRVDAFLASGSWDQTWAAMERLIEDAVGARERRAAAAARRTTRPGRGRRSTVRRPQIETPLAPRRSAGPLVSGASSAVVASLRPPAAE